MSRNEIREKLMEAIIECRSTTRHAHERDLTVEERIEAFAKDDVALGRVWALIEELG